MREQCLHNALFTDIYLKDKQRENEDSLHLFRSRIQKLDQLSVYDKWMALAKGVLAGNLFDWGAKAVVEMLESDSLSFDVALSKLQERPWLHDDLDRWLERMTSRPPYRCVGIFCDNSGADIVLGIIPLAREFLRQGTKVVLCANSEPVVNDITFLELNILIKRIAADCPIISQATKDGGLLVMETGQASPCLDLRFVDENLCSKLVELETDLLILEGMGRSIHTNLSTHFLCDSLKVALIKNNWLARRLGGGNMFSVVFKYDSN
ncbi:PANK4 [Bugula neritina]|uniref:4'-phosphopantetheine phosphatase n=1 Tax=Bugula neritina TaxID=10212 RepID=A0A7J7K7E0_BUGNE|nr:PANK4 [Bugula neritina]